MDELSVGCDLNDIEPYGMYECKVTESPPKGSSVVFPMNWYDCRYYLPVSSKIVIVSGCTVDVGGVGHAYSTVGHYVEKENKWYSDDHGHEGEELKGVMAWSKLPLPYKDTIERLYESGCKNE